MKNELTTLNHYSPAALENLAAQVGTNSQTLKNIIQGEKNRIKELLNIDEEQTRTALQRSIFGVLELYTQTPLRTADGVSQYARILIAECIKITIKYFKHLSITDINEAFETAEENGINVSAYYSKFSALTYKKILSAYNKKRNQIRQKIDTLKQIEEQQQQQQEKEQKNALTAQDVLKNYSNLVFKQMKGEEVRPEEVCGFWGPVLKKMLYLNVEAAEKVEIYDEAKKKALNRLKLQYSDNKKSSFEKNSIKKIISQTLTKIATGADPGEVPKIKELAESIYKIDIVLRSIKNDAEENKTGN